MISCYFCRLLCKGDTSPLTWFQRASIGEGMAKALNYLHTLKGKPLVHGDVKSANVLLDARFECKLGDFGLAKQIGSSRGGMNTHITVTSVHGTSVYLSPEYLRSKILSPAVDVYSYGVVMLEMATGMRAFDGKRLLIDLVRDKLASSDKCLEDDDCAYNLRDNRLANTLEGSSWFVFLIKLGLDCANKRKNCRPEMVQVLEYYAQCKTRDRIERLNLESKIDQPIPNDANIKSPLELQLWYNMIKRVAHERGLGSNVSSNVNKSANKDSNDKTEQQSIAQGN